MINVAFIVTYANEWTGGINYLGNLFYALSQLDNRRIKPVVFIGTKTDAKTIDKFQLYARVVQDSLFDKKSLKWFLETVIGKLFNVTYFKTKLLHRHNISVISHTTITTGCNDFFEIGWIPDFQHMHLPELFSQEELLHRDKFFLQTLQNSQQVIVSSYDAYNDARSFAPQYIHKVKVLQFVSQPNPQLYNLEKDYIHVLEDKYAFKGRFFFLPNQFWKHKNHALVFKAVKLLKDEGINVLVLCTGYTHPYKTSEHIHSLQTYIEENNLQENVKILGLIDYTDVLYFMRFSLAVINPSLFEGWSSTVEECKSIGKNLILSDIPIHKEQNPPHSLYFNPSDASDLAEKLKKVFLSPPVIPDLNAEKTAKEELQMRTIRFADIYQNIILDALKVPKHTD